MSQERGRFVAIRVPKTIQNILASVQNEFPAKVHGGSCTKCGNLHLILKFLGNLQARQIRVSKDEIKRVVGRHPIFLMWFGGIGVFPDFERPRVL